MTSSHRGSSAIFPADAGRTRIVLVLFLALLASLPASMALGADAPARTFRFFNREIVTLHASNLGLTPEDRVDRAAVQLHRRFDAGGPLAIEIRETSEGQAILVDGALVLMLFEGDAEPLGVTSAELAVTVSRSLRTALDEAKEAGSAHRLLAAAAVAAGATALLVLFLWLLVRVRRRVVERLRLKALAHAERYGLSEGSSPGVGWALRGLSFLVRSLSVFVGALASWEWLGFVLRRFPGTRPFGESLEAWFFDQIVAAGRAALGVIPNLIVAAAILSAAAVATRLLEALFERVEAGGLKIGRLDADLARPTSRIAVFAVWIFALAMAYPYLPGAQTDAFKGLSVLVGLMVSLGASNLSGQAVSGLILMYTRTLRIGEYVRIAEHEGTVVEIGAFATRIHTGMGEERFLPNALILGNVTRNYSRTVQGPGFVVDTAVTIGYDAPWRQVHAMLLEAAGRVPGVLSSPKPQVFQTALSDFYVEYRLVAQAIPSEPRPRAEVIDRLHREIQDVFNENGVQIMSPHYLGDPAEAKVVPKERWFVPPARKNGD